MCREGTDDTPLRLANGRPLMVAPWEMENCITNPGQHLRPGYLLLRREGLRVSMFEVSDPAGEEEA